MSYICHTYCTVLDTSEYSDCVYGALRRQVGLVRGLLLHGVVGLHGQLEVLGLHVHDDEHWLGAVAPVELVDAEVRGLDLGPRGVPAYYALLRVHLTSMEIGVK